jgi:hypothetical protein
MLVGAIDELNDGPYIYLVIRELSGGTSKFKM